MKEKLTPEELMERMIYLQEEVVRMENERSAVISDARGAESRANNGFKRAQNIAFKIDAIKRHIMFLSEEVEYPKIGGVDD